MLYRAKEHRTLELLRNLTLEQAAPPPITKGYAMPCSPITMAVLTTHRTGRAVHAAHHAGQPRA